MATDRYNNLWLAEEFRLQLDVTREAHHHFFLAVPLRPPGDFRTEPAPPPTKYGATIEHYIPQDLHDTYIYQTLCLLKTGSSKVGDKEKLTL